MMPDQHLGGLTNTTNSTRYPGKLGAVGMRSGVGTPANSTEAQMAEILTLSATVLGRTVLAKVVELHCCSSPPFDAQV